MNKGWIFIMLIFSLFFLNACKKKEISEKVDESQSLFQQSVNLIIEITNQYKESKDSLAIDSLNRLFEKRITDINFSVPPETDYKLTEQDNDSLYKLIQSMKEIKDKRLLELSKIKVDTIPEEEKSIGN